MRTFTLLSFLLCSTLSVMAQEEDLLSLLGKEEPETNYATASFKTNRVINLHSLENTAGGVLDFKISHRFGSVKGGFYDVFGLDQANMHLGLDYGITDNITVGVGRSSLQKAYDGFIKWRFFRQSTGKIKMPIYAAVVGTAAVQTLRWSDPTRTNYFSSRLYYSWQLLLGRKFSDYFTLQVAPGVVHRNLVATRTEKNDVYNVGVGGRIRLTRRLALNAEYIYVLPDQISSEFTNSLSVGFDIETGGHVFQLHFTNSNAMIEKAFIAETRETWSSGNIHFGFNISRVFTLTKPGTGKRGRITW